ncbi:hypothetical protein QQS21_008698 [Conoideocrella luteorostrata]|uniref:Aminoglycoside phosphotransferase domain-containing protein n=1 Tax=Conoideocrella luteorostrata TaxID=1105319 RepID=A0AAJ0FYG8_9HYPO|nr:hypothetical protein QQS21_008698 [Conoideocrella luteorostrata]
MSQATSRVIALSERQLANFFRELTSTTQNMCDQVARELILGLHHAAPVQGATSYTVVPDNGASFVVQFRPDRYSLDLNFLGCVEQAYPGFMPHYEQPGRLGKLEIYKIDDVRGDSMSIAVDELRADGCALLKQTVQDFGRFFASAWHNIPNPYPHPRKDDVYESYLSQLMQLSAGLPRRFRSTLDNLITKLPALTDGQWLMVPHHTDLVEDNIHVDRTTGRITGICDWEDTVVGPFGTSLWSLETLLGMRSNSEGWRYHANHQELRNLFWEAFYTALGPVSGAQRAHIKAARSVGFFLENGFVYIDEVNKAPIKKGSWEMLYLDAVARWL